MYPLFQPALVSIEKKSMFKLKSALLALPIAIAVIGGIYAMYQHLPAGPADRQAGLDAEAIRALDAQAEESWAYSVGVQTYIFGRPLAVFERERRLRLIPAVIERVKDFAPAAFVNQIGHMSRLATADDDMPYTPNNDTMYSGALLQLDDEPLILSVPAIHDRYWSVEVADNFTSNLLYIGTRATGGDAGNHAFVGPNWQGTLPNEVIEHRVASNAIMIALRIGVLPNDAEDEKKVVALQQEFALTSLSNWGNPKTFGQAAVPAKYLDSRPAYISPKGVYVKYTGELGVYQTLADLLSEDPLPKDQESAKELLKRAGIVQGQPFDSSKLSEATRKGLARAAVDGESIIEWKKKYRGTSYPTHWNNLRPGTYGSDYLDRAVGAVEGLFVHDREEAVYFSTYEDGQGNLFDGTSKYVLHLNKDEIPTTLENGFWSITLYRADGRNLQKNPLNRFSIGDRTKGIVYNADGSLDIYIQSSAPEGKESNWLPSPPSGNYRLNYRVYLPTESVRNPDTMIKYIPGVKKVG